MGCKCYGVKKNGKLLHNVYSEERNDVEAHIMNELLGEVVRVVQNYLATSIISINLDMKNFKLEYELVNRLTSDKTLETKHATFKYEIVEFEEK